MKKYKSELSMVSVILMMLVIFIHVASECVLGYDKNSVLFAGMISLHRLSSFAVQGFIFLSGVKLFLRTDGFNLGKFYLGRLCKVVIPYVLAFTVFFAYLVLTDKITPSASLFFGELWRGGLVNHFYFVVIICQFYLLIPLWRLLVGKSSPVITLTVSLILMIMFRIYLPEIIKTFFGADFQYTSRVFTTYLFYFLAGAFAGKHYDRFIEFLAARKRGIYALYAAVAVIDCYASWSIESGFGWLSWADMFHVIYCIAAILALMCLSLFITAKESRLTKALPTLNAASYNVYLIHPLFIFIAEDILTRLGITSLTLRFILKFIFTYILSIGLCTAWETVKKKIKQKKTA